MARVDRAAAERATRELASSISRDFNAGKRSSSSSSSSGWSGSSSSRSSSSSGWSRSNNAMDVFDYNDTRFDKNNGLLVRESNSSGRSSSSGLSRYQPTRPTVDPNSREARMARVDAAKASYGAISSSNGGWAEYEDAMSRAAGTVGTDKDWREYDRDYAKNQAGGYSYIGSGRDSSSSSNSGYRPSHRTATSASVKPTLSGATANNAQVNSSVNEPVATSLTGSKGLTGKAPLGSSAIGVKQFSGEFSPIEDFSKQKEAPQMSYAAPRKRLDGTYDPKQVDAYVTGEVLKDYARDSNRSSTANIAGSVVGGFIPVIGKGLGALTSSALIEIAKSNAGKIVNTFAGKESRNNIPEELKGAYDAKYNALEEELDKKDDFYSSWGNAGRSLAGIIADAGMVLTGLPTAGVGSEIAKEANKKAAFRDYVKNSNHPEAKALMARWAKEEEERREAAKNNPKKESSDRTKGILSTIATRNMIPQALPTENKPINNDEISTDPTHGYLIPGINNLWGELMVIGDDFSKYRNL